MREEFFFSIAYFSHKYWIELINVLLKVWSCEKANSIVLIISLSISFNEIMKMILKLQITIILHETAMNNELLYEKN